MQEDILNKILKISEDFFATAQDPRQIPVTKESFKKLMNLHPQTVAYRLDGSEPMSWIVVVPTSLTNMQKFLSGEFTEQELLDASEPAEAYEALYLCSAFTVPKHRLKGYVLGLAKEVLDAIPLAENAQFFTWPMFPEGEHIIKKLEKMFGITVHIKK